MKRLHCWVACLSACTMGCSTPTADTAAPEPVPVAAEPAPAPAPEPAAPVAPIPEGYASLTPQLVVPDVDVAMTFCAGAFGATSVLTLPGPDGKTMHGELKIGDSMVMLDAENAQMKSPHSLGGTTGLLMLYVPDAEATFKLATDAGAKPDMPPQEMFWGDRYGELTDPAGHRWAVATHVVDLTEAEMAERTQLAMAEMAAEPSKRKKRGEPAWKTVAGSPATQPTPPDYRSVTIALSVRDASKLIEFYGAAFGAEERNRMPMPDGKLMHAEVMIGDSILMLSDEMPGAPSTSPITLKGTPFMVHLYTEDAPATMTQAIQAGAKEILAMADQFWGDRYGAVVDPSGFGWGIATHIEEVSVEDMKQRMAEQQPPPG